MMIFSAFFAVADTSLLKRNVAANTPTNQVAIKAGTSIKRIPAKLSLIESAIVTAGLANEVEAVN
jgi:hypothetical protein